MRTDFAGKETVSNLHYQIQYLRRTFSNNREIDKITSFIIVEKNEGKLSMVIGWNCAFKSQSTNSLKPEIVLARMDFSEMFQNLNELF